MAFDHSRRARGRRVAPFSAAGQPVAREKFMACCGTLLARRARAGTPDQRGGAPMHGPVHARAECLEQLLEAFRDIIDHDDIHQAARRLALVQEWIRSEAEAAADNPIFADLPAG